MNNEDNTVKEIKKIKRNNFEKFIFVIFVFSAIYNILVLFAVPQVKHMPLDILSFRLSLFGFFLLAITIPSGAVANVKGIRDKLPLFNKRKIVYTLIAVILLVGAGFIFYNLSEMLLHSNLYLNEIRNSSL